MRIRTIKPEFWRSDDIAALDYFDRLLFIGLWSYVDDNGVGRDEERIIAADLFALDDDPRESVARVSRGLQHLSDAGLVDRYTVDERDFLHITKWERHQKVDRPGKARYPMPKDGVTRQNRNPRDTLAREARGCRETLAPGTGEQGNRGTGTPSLRSGGAGGDVPDVAGSHVVADAPTAPAKAKPKHKAIGTRLPDGWFPSRTPGNENAEAGHDQAWLQRELDRFRDYWAAQPGQRGRKADWDATWRNWVRKADDMGEARPRSRSATGLSDDEWQDAYRRAVARDAASADDTNSSNAPQALSLLPRSA